MRQLPRRAYPTPESAPARDATFQRNHAPSVRKQRLFLGLCMSLHHTPGAWLFDCVVQHDVVDNCGANTLVHEQRLVGRVGEQYMQSDGFSEMGNPRGFAALPG